MNSKNFQDLVRSSRSYRRFAEDEPLSYGDLAALVNAARFAPSGNNMQTLRFHIAVEPAERSAIFSRLHWAAQLRDWNGPAAGERPTGYIAVCAPKALAANPIRLIDTGIAAQTIALAAASRGPGSARTLGAEHFLPGADTARRHRAETGKAAGCRRVGTGQAGRNRSRSGIRPRGPRPACRASRA